MKKTIIYIAILLIIGANSLTRAEDAPGALLVDQVFTRKDNPILDILVFHTLTAAILVQNKKPRYPGDAANPRPNTPWYPHQWAAYSNHKMRDSGYQKTLSRTLSQSYGGTLESAMQAVSNGLNHAAYFVIAAQSAASPYYPTVNRSGMWDILRPGDTVYLDDGDQNVHLVWVYSKDEESIYILDMWPQKFFFRSTGSRVKQALADLVKVKKDDFLEYCAQITTLDSLKFPKRFVDKYLSDSDEASRRAAMFAFAVQLTSNQHLPSMQEGYDLLNAVIEGQVDYDPGFELNPRDLRDFAALFLFHRYSTIASRAKDDSSRQYAKRELESLKEPLKALKPRQAQLLGRLKASHLYRLAEAASLHNLTSAEELYDLTLAKDPNHIEGLSHRAATRIALNKRELVRKDIEKAMGLLKSELQRLKKLGIPKTEYEGRPDIFERNKSLQEVARLLTYLNRRLNR